MEVYQRRPVFQAVEFKGTTASAQDIAEIVGASRWSIKCTINNWESLALEMPGKTLEVGRGQYVVVDGGGNITLFGGLEFSRTFEQKQ